MLDRVMAAGLKYIVETDHVTFNIRIRVGDGIANARLCAKIDNNLGMILLEYAGYERLIS